MRCEWDAMSDDALNKTKRCNLLERGPTFFVGRALMELFDERKNMREVRKRNGP
jgi:hypothetical protein